MEYSIYLDKANKLLGSAREGTFSVEERREMAIDLAAVMLNEAHRIQAHAELRRQAQLERMMDDPKGKMFAVNLADECFRSRSAARVADQITYLLGKGRIPRFPTPFGRLQLLLFSWLGKTFPRLLVPLARYKLRRESSTVILPGERGPLSEHMTLRREEGARINLNHLGEAILGEAEAEKRLQVYLEDLAHPEVEYISVKISTLGSQLNLLGWDETLAVLADRLRKLYQAAKEHTYVRRDGKRVSKFVNLDMEAYRDLHLTVEVFRRVLEEPEFYRYPAGIVLQSYLPDAHHIQQELTVWAMQRVANGGAPIKIRIVKGANLAMERVDASLHGWPQAPYHTKGDVDANFKRMIHYGLVPDHARAAKIGVGSHNLFDIAYTLLLRAEMGVEKFVEFEMLEGMADHVRRVVQDLSGGMVLYCPAATKREFQNAIAYLVRRLDENTSPDNFLRHLFALFPDTQEWHDQANHFSLACHATKAISLSPRRTQNRAVESEIPDPSISFRNEPDTDWSLPQNRKWIQNILADKELSACPKGGGVGRDPSRPGIDLYTYPLADTAQVDAALKAAERAQKKWAATPVEERSQLCARLAHLLRENRGELIKAMVADAGKTVSEADAEVSEAIDFAEYYRRNREDLEGMADIRWSPKGVVVVAPPWNFPCAIPLGGIVSALLAGNCVIFKPALETAYVGWRLADLCWKAGVKKEVLQLLLCEDEPTGTQLIQDARVACVMLTGATETAKHFLRLRPGLDLIAETGGKNAIIITSMSDRDLAIGDLVQSAFGHAGQKCSACSLAICEAEVYDDPHFRRALRDAVASLPVGPAWSLATRVNPLIHQPNETLLRGLTQLEEGESWLLEPQQDPDNPNLWSPGIKLGVSEGSFTYHNELFGPVLGLMRADNLEHAVRLANGTRYGLTSGLHSLDEREHQYWLEHIQAGNCYINRGITGAIVRRQPFGGCKESSFGRGAKAGGPNFLAQLMHAEQMALPVERSSIGTPVNLIGLELEKNGATPEQMELWQASVESYVYHWREYFSKQHDPSRIVGQDNILKYISHPQVVLRVGDADSELDVWRVIAGAILCHTPLEVSGSPASLGHFVRGEWLKLASNIVLKEETEPQFIERVKTAALRRVRLLSPHSPEVIQALSEIACNAILTPVLANGRLELLHYLREVSVSVDYHRYGNLGLRENEERTPVL